VAYDNSKKFSFEIQGFPKDAFHVIRFNGHEGLSKLYEFDVSLYSTDGGVDFDKVFSGDAVFKILRQQGDVDFHGIITSFEQLQQTDKYTVYQARLSPKHWWLTQAVHNKIFLDQNAQVFLTEALKDGGLISGTDFEFRLMSSYPDKEYVCQYNETYFAFFSRWLERNGMYFYFEQGDSGAKMIVTDISSAHLPMPGGKTLDYSPPSGLDAVHTEEVVKSFTLKQVPVAGTVILKDYNYRTPSLDLESRAQINQNGNGVVYVYGEHYQTKNEGDALAKVRAEAIACRRRLFLGVSGVPFIRPGYTFEIKKHYRDSFNREYLTIEVVHEGSQEAYLTSGLGLELAGAGGSMFYHNSFTAIPTDVQFRTECTTPRPKLYGSLNAKVDAESSGQYAEVDSQGRYKVVMPFDIAGRGPGKATAWLRMAQPYAGGDHGMHFPLHKGTEVLITCIDGDPDRPIIAAAVPNPETPSPISDNNQTMAMITTSGQNKIHMEDQEGNQRILLQTPSANTWFRMGAPNDPPAGEGQPTTPEGNSGESGGSEPSEVFGATLYTSDGIQVYGGTISEVILGESNEFIGGEELSIVAGATTYLYIGSLIDTCIGLATDVKIGGEQEIKIPEHTEISPEVTKLQAEVNDLRAEHTELKGQHTVLSGDVSRLAGQTSKLAGATSKLSGNVTKLYGQTSALAGDVSRLAGECSEITGGKTDMIATMTRVTAEATKMYASELKTIGAKTQAVGEATATIGEQTEVAGELTSVGGLSLWL
jgi:type VI secretion system secreted protein VgrG